MWGVPRVDHGVNFRLLVIDPGKGIVGGHEHDVISRFDCGLQLDAQAGRGGVQAVELMSSLHS